MGRDESDALSRVDFDHWAHANPDLAMRLEMEWCQRNFADWSTRLLRAGTIVEMLPVINQLREARREWMEQ